MTGGISQCLGYRFQPLRIGKHLRAGVDDSRVPAEFFQISLSICNKQLSGFPIIRHVDQTQAALPFKQHIGHLLQPECDIRRLLPGRKEQNDISRIQGKESLKSRMNLLFRGNQLRKLNSHRRKTIPPEGFRVDSSAHQINRLGHRSLKCPTGICAEVHVTTETHSRLQPVRT